MIKLAQAASLVALTLAASSAGAWYGAPDRPDCMNGARQQAQVDRQDAFAQRQKAMAAQDAQYAQAAQQAMTAQREWVQRMTEQRSAYLAQIQQGGPQVPGQAVVPADPSLNGPFGPGQAGPGFPAMPEPPAFPEMAMPEMPTFPEMAMPEMPAFEAPAMPDYVVNRAKEMDAHRAQIQQAQAARRAAFKDRSERRRAERGPRGFGPYPARFAPGAAPGMGAGGGCGPAAAPTQAPAEPQAAAPAPAPTVAAAPAQQ